MNIKKIGHCCLVIKVDGTTILTDPGIFTTAQNELTDIDAILITHEHADHLHVDSVKAILAKNPNAKVITNTAVGKHLETADIPYLVAEGRDATTIKNISIEAFDCKHEEIYGDYGQVQNTAYIIAGKLLCPGDSYFDPGRPVETLALPVAGPWCRLADAMRYALAVKPGAAFPVHDGSLVKDSRSLVHRISGAVLKENRIVFTPLNEGDGAEF